MKGHMGKILRLDLTNLKTKEIATSDYEEFIGGHGMGSAIFFDAVDDKTISGFHPDNVITMMTSPLCGTLAPATGRIELNGISPQSYPTEWYSRSNFGGRFSAMLKYAGYDGLVIEGKADEPTWVNIINEDIEFRNAESLWGLDTWETQEEIWTDVSGNSVSVDEREWYQTERGRDEGRTTQKPAVATIGPAGENQTRSGAIIHDAGNGAGNAAFGSVWGSKNLKAISVLGTKSVEIANPSALLKAREWAEDNYNNQESDPKPNWGSGVAAFGGVPGAEGFGNIAEEQVRPQGCLSCHRCTRKRTESGHGNESGCVDFLFYDVHDEQKHGGVTKETAKAGDLSQRYGINVYFLEEGINYLKHLHEKEILGEGREIQANLPWDELGEAGFAKELMYKVSNKEGIGEDLAKGLPRAAKKWGRLEQDLNSGLLGLQYWGYPQHYDARTEVEWGYGSILGERDINEHDFNWVVYWQISLAKLFGRNPPLKAEKLAEIIKDKTIPYKAVPDYSEEGIYSKNMAKLVAWHRHYTRFWKQSLQYCDWAYADFVNPYGPESRGLTPEGETRFFNAVTGKDISFKEGMEIGRKIWNLDRAIWALQGRHRDQEEFAGYTYDVASWGPEISPHANYEVPYYMPVKENGEWKYKNVASRSLDKEKFNEWKTKFYEFEGWNTETGRPKRETLEKLGLGTIADELEQKNKI